MIKIEDFFNDKYLRVFKRLKPLSRKTYFVYLTKFFSLYGKDFSEENIYKFLLSLPKSTRNKAFFALKHYAKYNNIKFPFVSLNEFPEDFFYQFYDRKVRRLTHDEIKKFINACYTDKLTFPEKVAISLCAIYGLRRIEISKIRPKEDINLKERKILIRTAKKGKTRYHYIPTPILPFLNWLYVSGYEYEDNFFSRFEYICHKLGIKKTSRLGWHAFRRSLVTDLLNLGVPESKIYDFLRWSKKEIIFRYYLPDPIVIDKEIFSVHPYLPIFKEAMKKFVVGKPSLIREIEKSLV